MRKNIIPFIAIGLVVTGVIVAVVLMGRGPVTIDANNPTGSAPATPQSASFGVAVTLALGGTASFPDGLSVMLKTIDDSRCKPGVQCIWAGELAPTFQISGGAVGAAQDLRLGTMTAKEKTVAGYSFSLNDATATSATIVVTKAAQVASKDDLIRVTSPTIGQTVTSPLVVTGEARGNWYFEAQFPVKLLDGNGNVIASGPASAQGDWMTTDYVPFTITLTFKTPATATGTLVLEKDNPSDLPQNANELRIAVKFAE